jgi:hypothetical protein
MRGARARRRVIAVALRARRDMAEIVNECGLLPGSSLKLRPCAMSSVIVVAVDIAIGFHGIRIVGRRIKLEQAAGLIAEILFGPLTVLGEVIGRASAPSAGPEIAALVVGAGRISPKRSAYHFE